MHETPDDLNALQQLLDRSYERAGPHLKGIIRPNRRATAERISHELTGMCLLVLATATADGRPITGPVDGIFYRGAFHFGMARNAVRWRHIEARPSVSATHLPGEHLAVTVHGRALELDLHEHKGLRDTLLEIYVPRYGPEWETGFLEGDPKPVYARIEAERMFTFKP